MDFVIKDFSHEVYRTYCYDMRWFDTVLREIFKPIGHINKIDFHKVLVVGGENHGKVEFYQLFINFSSLNMLVEEFRNFKCKILTSKDYERKDFTFHFEPFKNLKIGDNCLFDIPLTSINSKKIADCFDWEGVSDERLSKRMKRIIKEMQKIHKPWKGKIVKMQKKTLFDDDCIYVELEDSTTERINLEDGENFKYITFEGLPTYIIY